MMQYATLEDTVYFWFGANNTSGTGADGSTPVYDVRLGGAASSAAPVLSGSATLLTHANYPDGCHEIAVAATALNGFAAGNSYAVFCTLLVDSQNPTGFVGGFKLSPVVANVTQWNNSSVESPDVPGVPHVKVVFPTALVDFSNEYASGTITANFTGNLSGSVGSVTGAVGSVTGSVGSLGATAQGNVRTAVGLASANLDTQLGDIPTNSELATALITGLTTALTEGYRGTGATGSVRDLLYEIIAHMGESSIAGTTKTLKKLDGSTTAKTYTLDSSTTPTAITETT